MVDIKEKREKIIDNLDLSKLPYNLNQDNYEKLGHDISILLTGVFKKQEKRKSLKWCFANVKRIKVFLCIFRFNDSKVEIYKEEIAKQIPEYSYKTIAKIIDEGLEQGFYISHKSVSKDNTRDSKIKNIMLSESLTIDFFNWSIELIGGINKIIKNNSKK
jgi:hypothetical protein